MSRPARISASFAAVVVAYWMYALIAVPLIEPRVRRLESDVVVRPEDGQDEVERQLRALQGLFSAGWDLKNAKILQSDQVKLLIYDYTSLGNGKVEIRPCAMIYTPSDPAIGEEERLRQAVVLEAPEGAVLQFDQPFELSRAKIGRLVNGRLKGRITIHSDSKRPGPEDDLVIVTREVDISDQCVSTPYEVEFRYGPNYGRGRQLFVKLLPGDSGGGLQQHGPNIAGIEFFQITQLDKLHLDFSDKSLLPVRKTPATAAAPPALAAPPAPAGTPAPAEPMGPMGQMGQMDGPIEVSCQGPFRFSPVQQIITFEDQVDVLRLQPNQTCDSLSCELLEIFLAKSRSAVGEKAASKKVAAGLDLQPRRLQATGRPVVLRAPSQNMEARGERLEYDIERRLFVLDGQQQEVVLRQEANEVHARSLEYQQSEVPGRLGRLASQGPGWLRVSGRFPQPFGARWNGQLHLDPDEDQRHVISLTGGAELTYGAMGTLAATRIFFWLFETPLPGAAEKYQRRPDRMIAQQNVQFNSPKLSGALAQMEVWFQQAAPVAPQAAASDAGREQRPVQSGWGSRLRTLIPTAMRLAWRYPALAQTMQRQMAGVAPGSPLDEAGPSRHFHVTGDILQALVLMRGEQADPTKLLIDGNVRFQETQTAQPGERPILITGDRVQIFDPTKIHAAVTVTGTRAHFEGPRIALNGTNINVNRGINRLWIDGAGRMDLEVDRDLEGRSFGEPTVMQIEWQRQMTFDGRKVHFEESVVAATPLQQVRTETLDVMLQQMIRFDEIDAQPEVKPARLRCGGGVVVESQTFDAQGLLSREKMQIGDLESDLVTGDLRANGPGWMNSVRLQAGNPMGEAGLPGGAPTAPPQAAGPAARRLVFLNVRFQGEIIGNLQRREMAFHDHVKTSFAPIPTWDTTLDPDDPDALGPEGFLLTCDRLGIADMDTPTGEGRAIALEATGDTVVEGQTFTARAVRMTYDKAKDLLILEGNGHTNAELSGQKVIGGPISTAAARKIHFWPTSRRLSIDGGRWLELNDLPTMGNSPVPGLGAPKPPPEPTPPASIGLNPRDVIRNSLQPRPKR
jgi:lipopolysaccharide export system protein LptA